MAIDPVCKMKVEESKAAATSEYKGKKYYFCAAGCKKAFDQNPEKYIAEEKNTIIIADAKYRDMAPSSFTGTNLLTQELLGDHALRYEADRQQRRLDYFRNNIEQFRKYLKPKHKWEEYNILSILVTKQIPLARRYKEVMIIHVTEFLQVAV